MIALVSGTLIDFDDKQVVVLTSGGVGYELSVPASVLSALPKKGGDIELFVHTAVSEKAIDLFGFASLDERGLFRTLISIDKLGPKKALAILSHFDGPRLREIAFREDAATLATVPGIGPKSAKQILWFLKEKVEGLPGRSSSVDTPAGRAGNEFLDALAGLKNLGYSDDEARPVLKDIFDAEPDQDAAGAIRLALKAMASRT